MVYFCVWLVCFVVQEKMLECCACFILL